MLRTEITRSHLNNHICQHRGMKTSTVTPSFYYVFNISLYCYDTIPNFIGNLWRVLLPGNHLNLYNEIILRRFICHSPVTFFLFVTVSLRCTSYTTQAGANLDVKTLVVKEEQKLTEKENNKKAKSIKKNKGKKKRKRKYEDVQRNNEQKFQDEHASSESDSEQKRVKKKKKSRR